MIEVFASEAIKLVKGLVSAKVKDAHPSPARAYFLIYTELRQIEQRSNHLLLWMRRWIDEYDQHSYPLYDQVYRTLEAIASSVLRLKELMDREFGLGVSVFDEGLARTIREVIGIKCVRLQFWISFFECKKLAEKKILLRFTEVATTIKTSYENLSRGDDLLLGPGAKTIEILQKQLHDAFGAHTEQVSIEDFDKLELMIRDGQDAVRKLHDAVEELSDFIRKNFQVSDLFEDRRSYILGKSD